MVSGDFIWAPSEAPTKSREPKLRRAQFGDGYSQTSPQGLNHMAENWELSFEGLTDFDANAIDAYLTSAGGYLPFYWRNPDNQRKRYICETWSRTYERMDQNSVRATFKEFFG